MPIYINFDGIPGESQSEGHRDWMDVYSFSWGETNSAGSVGGGAGGGRVNIQDFSVSKPSAKGSPKLFLACATGQNFSEVVVEVTRNSGESEALLQRYVLTKCMITGYQVGGDGGSVPTESLSLNFTKIEYTHVIYGADGRERERQTNSYDLSRNRGA
jgi:type VI secretion system secreted protein Hcp